MPMLNVGATVDPTSITTMADALIRIISVPGDQKTIRHAVSMLATAAKVEQISISHCTFSNDRQPTTQED